MTMDRYYSNEPTHCYSIAFCLHIIAYVLCLIAAFTPYWSEVKELDIVGTEIEYDKGPILSCDIPGGSSGCGINRDITGYSDELFITFLLVIASIFVGFIISQTLIAGVCIRSLRHRNLGIVLVVEFMIQVVILILSLVIFEESLSKDTAQGNTYESHTFGLSRYAAACATVLSFFCASFSLGEYIKRQTTATRRVHQDSPPVTMNSIAGSQASDKSRRTHPYYHNKWQDGRNIDNNNNNKNRKVPNGAGYGHGGSTKAPNKKSLSRAREKPQIMSPFDYKGKKSEISDSVIGLNGHGYRRY